VIAALVPTGRTVLLLGLLAPVAVVIAALAPTAWTVAPLLALALLVLAVVDGLMAARLADGRAIVPEDGEVGRALTLSVLADFDRPPASRVAATMGFAPLLGAGGRADCLLAVQGAGEMWAGTLAPVPVRRGTGTVDALWLRWPGPLGLAHRQARIAVDRAVRIWPDLSPVRSPTLQAVLRDARLGQIARRIRGDGSQFEALTDFEPGMDRRRIDWKASARHTRLAARENEAERDNQIVFALDCGTAMCEPVDGMPRIDRAVSAALTCAFVALKGGDRVALFGFAERPRLLTPFARDTRGFPALQQAAAGLAYGTREPNYVLALATLTARLQRRSLIVLFTDFTDPTAAEMMVESVERLLRHHLVILAVMTDPDLDAFAGAPVANVADIAAAVAADALAQQRALVLGRLRQLGVNVIEAPWQAIGFRLIDRYLATRLAEAIG